MTTKRLSAAQRLREIFTHSADYLWNGWGSVTSLFLFFALWELLAQNLGPLILPTPSLTFSTLLNLFHSGEASAEIIHTARRALIGYALAVSLGSLLGLIAGLSVTISMMARPIITLLIGTPPIAWLILALLWFGVGDGTPVFTVFIACFPIIFIGAMQGTRTLDHQWQALAQIFTLPWHMKLSDVYLPHVISYLFPSWISALGTAWKVVVMAELLASSNGIGAALAVTRSHLDTAASMAWIVALVGSLLSIEYLVLEPIKRKFESWRHQT